MDMKIFVASFSPIPKKFVLIFQKYAVFLF